MRELKFRYWDTFDKEEPKMIYFDFGMVSGGKVYPNMETTMQFTGLKDIHGNEIYEGDIVRFMYNSLPEQTEITGPVKFDEYNLSWKFGGYYIEPTPRKTIEVIGHIYEEKQKEPTPE